MLKPCTMCMRCLAVVSYTGTIAWSFSPTMRSMLMWYCVQPSCRWRRLMTLYDGIVSLGLAFHEQQPPLIKRPGARGRQARRPGHNLLIRLRNFKDDVLRFASNFAVPFTNNQAEQDIRMMKVKMKISGGFRSQAGAEAFAALRSVISTARKQRWDILKTLSSPPNTLIAALPA